ncbi:MAG: restriction endonuclease subunit S [Thaumarchaeota archaeon]|nr:restriction endonuclease subunit S [Nitrososphaerota archaeon]
MSKIDGFYRANSFHHSQNVKTLGEVIEIEHGFAFKGQYFTDDVSEDILLTPGNFAIGGGFKDDKLKYYNGPVDEKYVLKEGDLIVTMTDLSKMGDTLGYPALVPASNEHRYLHNQRLGKIVLKDENILLKKYLYYFLRSPHYHSAILGSSTGTTVKHTSPTRIKDVEIDIPSLEIQYIVSECLSKLDEAIINLRNLNHNLEKIIQLIFKSWFIDFDGQKEFVDSELGEIPKGWSVEFFGNILTIMDFGTSGSFAALKDNIRFYYEPEYAILVRAVDFNRNWSGDYVYTDKQGYNFSKKVNLQVGDVLLSNIGNVGTPFFAPDLEKPMTCGKNVLLIKTDDFKKNFVFSYLLSDIGQNTIRSILTGSAVPKFNKTDLKNTKLILPDEIMIRKFDKIVSPMQTIIQKNNKRISILEVILNHILPKLLSGEIRV